MSTSASDGPPAAPGDLVQSGSQLRAILDEVPGAIFVKDRAGRYLLVNRRFERVIGLAAAEVLGRTDAELLPAATAAAVQANDRRALEAGASTLFVEEVPLADGVHVFESTKTPLVGPDGTPYAICGVACDVTTERQDAAHLRRSEQSLANAQRIAHLGNWDWDIVGGELTWSDEVYRIFGARPGEFGATYEAFLGFVHPDDRAAVRAAVDRTLAGEGPYAIDHRVVRRDGAERIVHEQGEVVRDAAGRAVAMSGTVLDVTELRLAQSAAAARQAELEQARALAAVKTAFLSSVTHELRTPLTGIFGYAELLEDEVEGPLTAGQRVFMRRLMACGHQLKRLVDDLLESARMEANTFALRLETVDPAGLGRDAADALAPLAADAGVVVEAELPDAGGATTLDPQRVMQVVTNLLSNAIKFSPRGGVVRLRVRAADDHVRFEVADDGPGIAPEDRPLLFQRFSQLAAGRAKGGTGLGLAISRAIVEAHGGRIGVESEPGRGSTFWFELPAAGPA